MGIRKLVNICRSFRHFMFGQSNLLFLVLMFGQSNLLFLVISEVIGVADT